MLNLAMRLFARDSADSQPSSGVTPTMFILIIVLLALLVIILGLVAVLLVLRQRRRARKQAILPEYNEKRFSSESSASSNHRRGRARQLESVFVPNEKQEFIDSTSSPPDSPLPEIRITFPEEIDESGKRKSGRVVVVHVGDSAVGLEPIEALPAYQKGAEGRFDSIDLERVGGLIEKARNAPK